MGEGWGAFHIAFGGVSGMGILLMAMANIAAMTMAVHEKSVRVLLSISNCPAGPRLMTARCQMSLSNLPLPPYFTQKSAKIKTNSIT